MTEQQTVPKSVLFVCLGNICRSPAAEGVLKHLLEHRGQAGRIRVESAGTSGYHIDELPDRRMRTAAARRGMSLISRSRMVHIRDLRDFNLIVAMDESNYRELVKLNSGTSSKICLLSDFLDESWPREVPDPYYGGDEGFEQVLDMLEAACPQLLSKLCGERDTCEAQSPQQS
jgi:protein-tyrosine phosphatase